MIDTTTTKDLAKKMEWIGLRNMTYAEREELASDMIEASRYLPRLLALALWSYFGEKPPSSLVTRGVECGLQSFKEREDARALVAEIMSDLQES